MWSAAVYLFFGALLTPEAYLANKDALNPSRIPSSEFTNLTIIMAGDSGFNQGRALSKDTNTVIEAIKSYSPKVMMMNGGLTYFGRHNELKAYSNTYDNKLRGKIYTGYGYRDIGLNVDRCGGLFDYNSCATEAWQLHNSMCMRYLEEDEQMGTFVDCDSKADWSLGGHSGGFGFDLAQVKEPEYTVRMFQMNSYPYYNKYVSESYFHESRTPYPDGGQDATRPEIESWEFYITPSVTALYYDMVSQPESTKYIISGSFFKYGKVHELIDRYRHEVFSLRRHQILLLAGAKYHWPMVYTYDGIDCIHSGALSDAEFNRFVMSFAPDYKYKIDVFTSTGKLIYTQLNNRTVYNSDAPPEEIIFEDNIYKKNGDACSLHPSQSNDTNVHHISLHVESDGMEGKMSIDNITYNFHLTHNRIDKVIRSFERTRSDFRVQAHHINGKMTLTNEMLRIYKTIEFARVYLEPNTKTAYFVYNGRLHRLALYKVVLSASKLNRIGNLVPSYPIGCYVSM